MKTKRLFIDILTGLLFGLCCQWVNAQPLSNTPRDGYPEVEYEVQHLMTDNGRIFCAGRQDNVVGFMADNGRVLPWTLPRGTWAIAAEGDTIYAAGLIGGYYTNAASEVKPLKHLAAINRENGQLLDWNPQVEGLIIESLYVAVAGIVAKEDKIYVGGVFNKVDSVRRLSLAGFDRPSGRLNCWTADIVANLGLQPVCTMMAWKEKIVIAGQFTQVGGVGCTNLALVDAYTEEVTPIAAWKGALAHQIYSVCIDDDVLYVGGYFEKIGANICNGLAAVDLKTKALVDWYPLRNAAPLSSVIRCVAIGNGVAYVGGGFTIGGTESRTNLAAIDLASGNVLPWNPQPNGTVYSLAWHDGKLFVGGSFTQIGGVAKKRLAVFAAPGASWMGEARVETNMFKGRLYGEPGRTYVIEASTNLLDWTQTTTGQPVEGRLEFTDPLDATQPRYYRACLAP